MTVEELERQLKSFQSDFESTKKEFELKIDAAKKDASDWKTIAGSKEEELKKFQKEAEEAKASREKAFAEARKAENASFMEKLKAEGKITPAMQEIATKLMESMTSDVTIAVFESGGKKISHSQLSLFKEFLSMLQKKIVYGSMTPAAQIVKSEASNGSEDVHYSEAFIDGRKQRVVMDDMKIHMKALELQEECRTKGKVLFYEEAIVEAEKKIRMEAIA